MVSAMESETKEALPLAGVRVLDFSHNLPGPYATFLLASLGAEVIKVEPPSGDSVRSLRSFFSRVNRGKKSVVLDLREEEDKARLKKILPSIDVVVEGFRPGVMGKFGFDAKACAEIHPALIYCSISGFGQSGPRREHPAHDLNLQALTGICHLQRDAKEVPQPMALPLADFSSAQSAAASILAALLMREKDGQGRYLDVAMADTTMSWASLWHEGLNPNEFHLESALDAVRKWLKEEEGVSGAAQRVAALLKGEMAEHWTRRVDGWLHRGVLRRVDRLRLHWMPHYALFETRDQRHLALGIVGEDKFWRKFCEAVGLSWLARVPLAARAVGAMPIKRWVSRAIAKKDLDEWLELLDESEVPVTPVLTPQEASVEPHMKERPVLKYGDAGSPLAMGRTPQTPAPELGADSASVFKDEAD